eukprot:TRINITY_DN575_c14_g1_i1.p1 TRINITY_DN575_c14_g1~~TRINITY_DN575_c14_g1_i1.p1  ORF type:complete len:353 (+),score=101.96 TRINITY_DN575_c14_g1_i1:79-1137(+)
MLSIMTIGTKESRSVLVRNVHEGVDAESLRKFIGAFGTLEELERDSRKGQEATWTATFGSVRDARAALLVDGTPLNGVPVSISSALAEGEQDLLAAGGMPGSGTNPAIDPITMAAFKATEDAEGMPSVARADTSEVINGVTIQPELMGMLKEKPSLALEIIPRLQKDTTGALNETQMQWVQMCATFHKQRENKEKADKERARHRELVKQLQDADSSDDGRRRRRSSRSSSSGRRRRRRADPSYTTDSPTEHLVGVFEGVKAPVTAEVRTALERGGGTLADIKVSKSKSCIYATFCKKDEAVDAKARLDRGEEAKCCGAATVWHFAKTNYKKYLANETRDRRSRSRSRRRRRR